MKRHGNGWRISIRGSAARAGSLFCYTGIEARVSADHPARRIRELVNMAQGGLDAVVSGLYARQGRPSIAPDKLLRASLLQILYPIRSERQLMERLEFDLLFRCFVVNGVRADTPLGAVLRGVWPFVIADMLAVALLTAFPEIVTFILVLGV